MAAAIDSIVFDIGNVLIDWNPRYLYEKIFASPDEIEWFLANVCTSDWNMQQDAGRAWHEGEAELIARYPQMEAEIRAFRQRWLEMVRGAIPGMPELFDAAGQSGYRRLAISNFAADTFELACERFPFLTEFDGAAISGCLNLMKPDHAIFHWLIDTCDVRPERAVFVDDSIKNIEAARHIGFHAVHFRDSQQFREALALLGVNLSSAEASIS